MGKSFVCIFWNFNFVLLHNFMNMHFEVLFSPLYRRLSYLYIRATLMFGRLVLFYAALMKYNVYHAFYSATAIFCLC